jgi:protein O-mannosyl-transferase
MKRRGLLFSIAAVVGLAVIVHLPALRNGFIWDDNDHLTENRAVADPHGLQAIWSSLEFSRYYPLTLTTFWAQRRLWGLNPLPYHAVNIALHALSAVLVFALLRRLNVRAAWAAAALWAVHPVNVESVAWVTELKNAQSGVFFFLSLWSYLQFDERRQRSWYVVAIVAFLAALLSKPSTVTLPAIILLCVWWQRRRWDSTDLIRIAPFFALSAVMSLVTIIEQRGHIERAPQDWSLSLTERLIVAGKAVWFYAGKALWPVDLSFVYPRWTIRENLWPVLGLGGIAAVLWHYRQRDWVRAGLFGLGYFVTALLPVLGFFDIYYFRYSFVADHFQYLASVGIIALVAAAGATFLRPRAVQVGALTLAVAGLGALSWQHAQVFQDDETLWRDTLARNPDAFLARNNLGTIFNGRKQYALAAEQFRAALALKPEFLEAHSNLGLALTELGRYDEAEQHLLEAVRIKPDFANVQYCLGKLYARMNRLEDAKVHCALAIQSDPGMAEAHYDLGTLWQQQGERARAIACYTNALVVRPDYAEAHNNLANLLAEDGKLPEAIEHYRQALNVAPDLGQTHYNLGVKLAELKRNAEAIEHLRAAKRLMPAMSDTYIQLAKALGQDGRFAEAIATLQSGLSTNSPNPAIANEYAWLLVTCPVAELRNAPQAIQIGEELAKATGRQAPQPLDTLAAAYAEAGRYDEAVAAAREALAVAEAKNLTNLTTEIKARLLSYKNGRAYHQAQHE